MFTSIQNNLLMIKLLKKEERAYFFDNYRARSNVKEMHITNSIFVRQSFPGKGKRGGKKEAKAAEPESMRDYRTLRQTLCSVQALLAKPLRTHKQTVFQQVLGTFKKSEESDQDIVVADQSSVVLDEDEDEVSSAASDIDECNEVRHAGTLTGKRPDRGPLRASIVSKRSVGREPRTSSVTNFNRSPFPGGTSQTRNKTP